MSGGGLDAVVGQLRRPFPPESVKFKVQTNPKQRQGGAWSKGLVVAFIDARNVSERLNQVVGAEWSTRFVPSPVGSGIVCELTVMGATRADVGFSQDVSTDIGVKTAYSDALKRAAVHFGVGAFLYSLPRMFVDVGQLKQLGKSFVMPDATLRHFRSQYADWLKALGAEEFGEPLGHGDREDSQGDTETAEAPAVVVDDRPDFDVDFYDYARVAILAKDPKSPLKDDGKWVARQLKLASAEDHAKFRKGLIDTYANLGGDSEGLVESWTARLAQAA